jgi:serine/threonine-protein kinase
MSQAPIRHSTVSPGLIEKQLDRITASSPFSKSERICRLLRHLAENSIAGRTEKLKEYSIGVDVFDKDPSYDPRIDTNVRTEARRLRAKLAEYYKSEGVADQLRIDLPKGGYTLVFELRQAHGGTVPAQWRWRRMWAAVILLTLTGLAWVLWNYYRQKTPFPRSIAVLPFVDLSPDKTNEYFSDGLTEELTDALTRIDGLRVAARTSPFQFKAKTVDVREVGLKLDVDAVLEGSVRKAGNQLRITARLDNTKNGYHFWSRTWERELNDAFAIQQEIAGVIAASLGTPVRTRRGGELVRASTRNVEAHNLYLLGRYHWGKRNPGAINQAIDYLQRAVELDPGYALAYAALADAWNVLPTWANTGQSPLCRKQEMPR